MEVRPAAYADALDAAALLRRSITGLCVADHLGDPARLEPWLANKTPEMFARWIDNADNRLVCAVCDGRVVGVGALRRPDEVMLVYVHPEALRRGAGRALMARLEALAGEEGARAIRLTSTRTAHPFYSALGYRDVGETAAFGMPAFQMVKELTA